MVSPPSDLVRPDQIMAIRSTKKAEKATACSTVAQPAVTAISRPRAAKFSGDHRCDPLKSGHVWFGRSQAQKLQALAVLKGAVA